jgi:addiction module HigA family antidote
MRIPIHPRELLKEELGARNISANGLAKALGIDAPLMKDIVRCQRSITAETALRLAQYFGGDAKVWLKMQMNHDLSLARKENGGRIKKIFPAN